MKLREIVLASCLLCLTRVSAMGQQAQVKPLPGPHQQLELPTPVTGWHRYWDKGYLVSFDTNPGGNSSQPEVLLHNRNGSTVRRGVVWFKGAESVSLDDASVSRRGDLVVAGGTMNKDGVIANFIAAVGKDGSLSQVIRTTPFLPVYVCMAEDGTVWSYGADRDENGKRVDTSPMLRHYSFDKGQIGAMLDMAELNSAGWKLLRGSYPGAVSLRCSSGKVGLLNVMSSEYIEVDVSTNTLKIRKLVPLPSPKQVRVTGFALTESGGVFASLHDRSTSPPRSGIFELVLDDSGFGSWVPVQNTIGPYLRGGPVERLLGSDGEDLVYTHDFNGPAFWSKVTH